MNPAQCFVCPDFAECIATKACHSTGAAVFSGQTADGNVIFTHGNIGVAGAVKLPDPPRTTTSYEEAKAWADSKDASAKNLVNHPAHYGTANDPFEAIKVIDAWNLGFCDGNVIKYIRRAGQKNRATRKEDLQKAAFYLNHEIEKLDK